MQKETKASDVTSFLTKTGFILEMEITEFLKGYDYQTKVNKYFLDLEEGKKREIDIIATKEINKILVHLIIECKQSLYDDWVFICSDKKPSRYYYAVKHLPQVYDMSKCKIFDSLHIFDRTIPLAQIYLAFQKEKGAKTEAHQIEECLFKLPKALLYVASKAQSDIKSIFFPIGLFNRQLFTAIYDKKLLVEEKKFIQYQIDFESKAYQSKSKINRLTGKPIGEPINDFLSISEISLEENEIDKIVETAELLGKKFQIDFVTQDGLKEYVEMIEKEIKEISVKKWSFNIEKARPKRIV